jgi:hypothetical protein
MANIKVKLENGKHKCDPTRTTVRPSETVTWSGSTVDNVFFVSKSPFKGGLGPFKTGPDDQHKVRDDVQIGEVFTFDKAKLEGDIIIG